MEEILKNKYTQSFVSIAKSRYHLEKKEEGLVQKEKTPPQAKGAKERSFHDGLSLLLPLPLLFSLKIRSTLDHSRKKEKKKENDVSARLGILYPKENQKECLKMDPRKPRALN